MTRARWGALVTVVLCVTVLVTVLIARSHDGRIEERPDAEKPTLLLLTSLPIMFGEEFSLDQPGSDALKALERRYRVVPISVAEPAELAKGKLLLMVQPLAQPAEDLVALDRWVRGGGRVLLMADPMLEWPSRRPLGDPLRPPPMFVDTGLLAHWGLRLDAPEERGTRRLRLAGRDVMAASPGSLFGSCRIGRDRLVAHCAIGKGRATIVADADLLNAGDLGAQASGNLPAVIAELALLERR